MKRDPNRQWVAPRNGGYSAVEPEPAPTDQSWLRMVDIRKVRSMDEELADSLIGGDEYTKGVEYRGIRGILGWFGMERRPATRPTPKRGGYSGRMDIGELGPPDRTPSGYVPPPGRAAASPRPCCCHCSHGA